MDSKLLIRLETEAASTQDPIVWAKALCRSAAQFATFGRTEQAVAAIGNVRTYFGASLHEDVACWLMLAEGVLHVYQGDFPRAFDRLRRAYALAVALGKKQAFPSCAAWLAHVEFNEGKFDAMASHVSECFALAEPDDHRAVSRAALVIAIAFHFAGQLGRAKPWYEIAKDHAAAEEDESTTSAALHNLASFNAWNVRLEDALGLNVAREIQLTSLEAGSSYTYDTVIGSRGMDAASIMLRAVIATIERKYSLGTSLYHQLKIEGLPQRLRAIVHADIAWCEVNLAHLDEAKERAALAVDGFQQVSEPDDRAYVCARLMQISARLGDLDAANQWRAKADQHVQEHRAVQAAMLEVLDRMAPTPEKIRARFGPGPQG